MEFDLEIKRIGNSNFILIPKIVLEQLNKKVGDKIKIEIKELK